jgi:hypothetical protein
MARDSRPYHLHPIIVLIANAHLSFSISSNYTDTAREASQYYAPSFLIAGKGLTRHSLPIVVVISSAHLNLVNMPMRSLSLPLFTTGWASFPTFFCYPTRSLHLFPSSPILRTPISPSASFSISTLLCRDKLVCTFIIAFIDGRSPV